MKFARSLILAIVSATSEDDNSLLQNIANRQMMSGNCQSIKNEVECKAAAEALGLKYKRANLWKRRPHGCVKRANRQGVSYNFHPGSPNAKYLAVCLPKSEPADIEDIADEVVDEVTDAIDNTNSVQDGIDDVIDAAEDVTEDDVDDAVDDVTDIAEENYDDAVEAAEDVTEDDVADAVDIVGEEAEELADTDAAAEVEDMVEGEVDAEVAEEVVEDAVDSVWERLVDAISSCSADDGDVCIDVKAGEVAPIPGTFLPASQEGDVSVDDTMSEAERTAPEDGSFCVEVDVSNWRDVREAINNLDEDDTDVCFDVDAGDAAPLRGTFSPAENPRQSYAVDPSDTAPVAGVYCVEIFDGL